MDNSTQPLSWTEQVISIWTESKIKLQDGIALNELHDFEKLLDFGFPQDFVDLYTKVNGFKDFDCNEHMFSLWSLDTIIKEYQRNNDPNYIGFCDYMINSHTIGYFKSDNRIYNYYNSPDAIADNFRDFIVLLNSNDKLLY